MLYIAAESANMAKAEKYLLCGPGGPMQCKDHETPACSARGAFGNATLATRPKGEKIIDAQIDFILRKIQNLRKQ